MKKIIALIVLITFSLCPLHADSLLDGHALLFTGNANPALAAEVAKCLQIDLGKSLVKRFNDGEIRIRIQENVRGKDVYIMQSTCQNGTQTINDSVMELLLMVRTAKRASAESITAVIPYYGYARQDRKVESRVPISAADVAMLLEHAGVDRVIAIDLHCGQIQGFFQNIPVDNLYASSVFVPYFAGKNLEKVVVVSPDAGGVSRAKQFMEKLAKYGVSSEIAMIIKQRKEAGVVDSMNLVGDVQDADVILVDDLCDTGGTLVKAAEELKNHGARRVFAAITHPVFTGSALEKIGNSVIEEMVISDTIPLSPNAPKNVKQISVASLLAEAIKRSNNGQSVSALFD